MKTIVSFAIIFLLSSLICFSQTKKELELQIYLLKTENLDLKEEIIELKKQNSILEIELEKIRNENERLSSEITAKSNEPKTNESTGIMGTAPTQTKSLVGGGRCQAITAKGTQCSRNADPGSDYCWQHKSTYEPKSVKQSTYSTPSQSSDGGEYYHGHKVYTGPRGGKYYINSSGNKTYIKH